MSESTVLKQFQNDAKESQQLWALQDTVSGDWVVMDSINFEDSEVMPLWSTEALAKVHCVDEWKDYQAAAITVADWLEFWVEDLVADNVLVGINWVGDEDDLELDLPDLTAALAEIEKL